MIYLDPSEQRQGSLLPEQILRSGVQFPNLEKETGADILVAPSPDPKTGILIQRKTGNDLLQSIPKLATTILRMTESGAPVCFLLSIGTFTEENGMVAGSNWTWRSLSNALDRWQMRGGLIHNEPNDNLASKWIIGLDTNLHKLLNDSIRRKQVERLVIYKDPRTHLLTSLPGCGPKTAEKLLDNFGTVQEILTWIQEDGTGVQSVGKKRIKEWQNVLTK